MTTRPEPDAGPLKPHVLLILMSLMEGTAHGYAMRQQVERLSGGAVVLDPGTLYRHLGRMLDDGLIAESDERPDDDDPRRRYYGLTEAGAAALRAEADRMESLAAAVRASDLAGRELVGAKGSSE